MNDIREIIKQLEMLTNGWAASGEVAEIERDLALEKLRKLYDAVRFVQAEAPVAAEQTTEVVPMQIDLDEVISLDPLVDVIPEILPEIPSETLSEVSIAAARYPEPDYAPTPEPMHTYGAVQMEEYTPEHAYPGETTPAEAEPPAELQQEELPAVTEEQDDDSTDADEPDVFEEIELEPMSQPEPQTPEPPQEEPEPQPETAPDPIPEPQPTPAPAPQPVLGSLFGAEEQALHRHKQQVIRSLYHTEERTAPARQAEAARQTPVPEPAEEMGWTQPAARAEAPAWAKPAPSSWKPSASGAAEESADEEYTLEELPASTPGAVLGDVMNQGVQTLSDSIAPSYDTPAGQLRMDHIDNLRHAIGINDKFLMIRDLFNGDGEAYEEAISALDNFNDLDDCMIHIAENYTWNPNCDGAKLLMELLERKYA